MLIMYVDDAIRQLMKECHETAVDKGWYALGDRNFGELIALMHSELSEALEEHRNGEPFNNFRFVDGKPEGIAVELADVLIRVFDACEHKSIPLADALMSKMEYNRTRPYRHGGKKA